MPRQGPGHPTDCKVDWCKQVLVWGVLGECPDMRSEHCAGGIPLLAVFHPAFAIHSDNWFTCRVLGHHRLPSAVFVAVALDPTPYAHCTVQQLPQLNNATRE